MAESRNPFARFVAWALNIAPPPVASLGGPTTAGATAHIFPLMRDDGSYVSSATGGATGAGFTGALKRPADDEVADGRKSQKTSDVRDAIQSHLTTGDELDELVTRMVAHPSPEGRAIFYSVQGTEMDNILERVCNKELVPIVEQ